MRASINNICSPMSESWRDGPDMALSDKAAAGVMEGERGEVRFGSGAVNLVKYPPRQRGKRLPDTPYG